MTKITTNAERIDIMRERLHKRFSPSELIITDDSHHHAGHAGAASGAGHFSIKIRADAFAQQSAVTCHRLVYKELGDMMDDHIHALKIDAKASAE